MQTPLLDAEWEALYAPYDSPTYQQALRRIVPDDVILDIGAGDLRLSRKMSGIARKVYAVEINASLLNQAAAGNEPLPPNLIMVHADARTWEFPSDVTTGVLLMRHCTHFRLYDSKLKAAGATRLITNARWRMAVEEIDLSAPRTSFADLRMGWYACSCGATGFKEGPAEDWIPELDPITNEVSSCPHCTNG